MTLVRLPTRAALVAVGLALCAAGPLAAAQEDPFAAGVRPPAEPLVHDPGWSLPASPAADAYRFRSHVLDEERRIFVVLPESFDGVGRPYPILLVLDGESILPDVAEATRALVRAGHMPEVLLVGIENTDRIRDLSPAGIPVSGNDGNGRAEDFWLFLDTELRPKLAREFRARGPLFMVGHSSGGLFVTWAAGLRVAGVVALDAPVHLGEAVVARTLVGMARSWDPSDWTPAPRGALRLVSVESRFGWSDADWAALTAARPAGWTLARQQLPEESHGSMVYPGTYSGLRALFADYGGPGDRRRPPTERLARFDERLSELEAWNAPEVVGSMPPPRALLSAAIEDRIVALDRPSAEEALDRLESAYGVDERSDRLRARIAAMRPDELVGPTLEELRSTPMAAPDAAAPLLGEWSGFTEVEGASRRTPLRLTVREARGSVVAEIVVGNTPAREVEYLTVDGQRVHVGYMNGMNPRGMLLYEGEVVDDRFEGFFVLRGVVFRMPDGRELPVTRFSLERVR